LLVPLALSMGSLVAATREAARFDAKTAGGESGKARGLLHPADREEVFELLSRRILVWCKMPDLQAAARLSERQCLERVRAAEDRCKADARVLIPEVEIATKEQYEKEFKLYMDCLIPPTGRTHEPERHGLQKIA
jgi:hypothetical protein